MGTIYRISSNRSENEDCAWILQHCQLRSVSWSADAGFGIVGVKPAPIQSHRWVSVLTLALTPRHFPRSTTLHPGVRVPNTIVPNRSLTNYTNMLSCFVLSQIVIRTHGAHLGASDGLLLNTAPAVSPLKSALPQNAPVTPLQSADPKTLALNSFRIRTCKKGWGRGQIVN